MVSTDTEQVSYHSGCGRVIPVLQGDHGGIAIHLHCSGCGEDIQENDVFDVTGYRTNEQGRDEVSFICPFCGAASISLRISRV
jgi:predicted RNA-binding Zn-ribbon protein involved in translation (DUF1610 family)